MPQEAPYYLMIIHHENANMVHVERSTITVAPVRRGQQYRQLFKGWSESLGAEAFSTRAPNARPRTGAYALSDSQDKIGREEFRKSSKKEFRPFDRRRRFDRQTPSALLHLRLQHRC
jgi:hypothetical protein